MMFQNAPFPRAMAIALLLASLGLTSGCGIAGDVTPAPPMWGDARAEYEAEQARKREAEAKAGNRPPAAPAPQQTTPPPAS